MFCKQKQAECFINLDNLKTKTKYFKRHSKMAFYEEGG